MPRLTHFLPAFIGAALLLSLVPPAHAADGVLLINQSTASMGLPGCGSSGFPIIICKPGSYRLSGNLTVTGSAGGIVITADHVSLDLNGFTIALDPAGDTGVASGNTGITLTNGVISGGAGVSLGGTDETVRGLTIRNSRVDGLDFGSGLIEDTTVDGAQGAADSNGRWNGGIGISIDGRNGTVVTRTRVSGAYIGFDILGDATLNHVTVRACSQYPMPQQGAGIVVAGGAGLLLQNSVLSLDETGLIVFGGSNRVGFQNTIFKDNGIVDVQGGTSLGGNLCTSSYGSTC